MNFPGLYVDDGSLAQRERCRFAPSGVTIELSRLVRLKGSLKNVHELVLISSSLHGWLVNGHFYEISEDKLSFYREIESDER